MAGYGFLSTIAGGAKGASAGLGDILGILERAKAEKKADSHYQDEQTFRNSELDYRKKRDTTTDQHDAALALATGKFRLKNVLDAAAGSATNPNVPAVYGDNDPNAPTQSAPSAASNPVSRALSMADLEPIPQDELDADALRKRDQLEGVLDKHQPWAPHTEQEYIDSRRRETRSGDAVNDESRAALRDQRINNLKANHVTRAVAGALGRLQAQGVNNPTPQQVHAAATNELLANPDARKLFLTTGRASDYDQLRDEVWSGLQTRTDKLTRGKKPPAEWTPEGEEVTPASSNASATSKGDVVQPDRKTVPDQAAYDELRQKGLSATAIRTRYNLDPAIKRVW